MTWRHDDLAADLAAHLRAPARMVWCDMQLGPQGSPRPDVYAIDRSFVKWSPTAYEVKISVADFRSDVTSGKWMSYRRYAGAVVFAVPAGLVSPVDLPQGCGLMVRGEAGWRTARKPTREIVESLPTAAWLKLLMDGVDREGGAVRLETGRRMRMDAHATRLFGQAVARQVRDASWAENVLRDAEWNAERIIQGARDQAEVIREAQAAQAPELWRHLIEALGVPPEKANRYTVRDAITKLRACSAGAVPAEPLRRQVTAIQSYIDEIVRLTDAATTEQGGGR